MGSTCPRKESCKCSFTCGSEGTFLQQLQNLLHGLSLRRFWSSCLFFFPLEQGSCGSWGILNSSCVEFDPIHYPCRERCQPGSGQSFAAQQTVEHEYAPPKCTLSHLSCSRTGCSGLWLAKPFWLHTLGSPIRPSNLDPSCLPSPDFACRL